MPLLIAAASGDLTAAATWGLAEAGTGAQLLNPSASTNTTASYVYSSTFTGTNTNVVDGIALFCNRLTTTGTVTVALSDDNGVTATRSVTVNASDLPADESWVFFKFGVTLTLDGGTDYRVGVLGSSAGNARFYRDATAGNWARILRRTTAPASVAAGDTFLIAGEWTGAGASTARTVTMNSTALTDYGTGVGTATSVAQGNPQAFTGLQIGQGGTLTWASAGLTAYQLRLSGNLIVWAGGTYNMGTVATPCPRDSTMFLEFDCVADTDFGFWAMNGSTTIIQGQSRSAGKNFSWTLLNTDEAIASTSLGVANDTGWLDNDRIAVAGTGRPGGNETGLMNGNAGAATLTVDGFAGAGGGLASAKLGTPPHLQAEVILLQRNVMIYGKSTTVAGTFAGNVSAVMDIDWCEFRYIGHNSVNFGRRGVNLAGSTASKTLHHCSIVQSEDTGLVIGGANFTVDNCVFNANAGSGGINLLSTTASDWSITNNVSLSGCRLESVRGNISNNRMAGSGGWGFDLRSAETYGTFANNVAHSNTNGDIVFSFGGTGDGLIDGLVLWRSNNAGGNGFDASRGRITVNNLVQIGQVLNISAMDVTLINPSIQNDAGAATTHGIGINQNAKVTVIGGNIGTTLAHSVSSVRIGNAVASADVRLINTTLANATEIELPGNLSDGGFVSSHNHDNVIGQHRTWKRNGRCESDATIFHTAAPSERLTPTSASAKLPSGSRLVAVDSGASRTINVWVRKSVVGDGAAYNGAQPRLILRRNDGVGIAADTVLDTMTAAAGTWEQLTGTTATATSDGAFEVIVDCDGTAGWCNVDDWSVT